MSEETVESVAVVETADGQADELDVDALLAEVASSAEETEEVAETVEVDEAADAVADDFNEAVAKADSDVIEKADENALPENVENDPAADEDGNVATGDEQTAVGHQEKPASDDANGSADTGGQNDGVEDDEATRSASDWLGLLKWLASQPVVLLVGVFAVCDRPFANWSSGTKDVLGYIGLATLAMALLVWILPFFL